MSNPNNVSLNTNHTLEFIDGNALTIPTLSILTEDGDIHPGATAPDISKHTAIKLYETMRFIRLLDERMQGAQRQGRVSFYMQCLGEEAAVTASAAALDQNDMIMAQYREQAALHYRGFTLDQFMNQMFSNELDLGKGRQMPIHYGSKELNYMTISSPLGTQIPQATGYAYGQKIKHIDAETGELASTIDNVTICYFGEGAASEGDFHAGLNMAAVHRAPVYFLHVTTVMQYQPQQMSNLKVMVLLLGVWVMVLKLFESMAPMRLLFMLPLKKRVKLPQPKVNQYSLNRLLID
jgi:2-oxoisovalerate dehydrogenase E1 component alpha subunit